MKKKVLKKQNNSRNCFVCGVMNDMGLKSAFYELEDGTVAALVEPKPEHQSYPMRVHGGVISAMLDETIGRAINITEPDTWAVTGELTVRFKKPVPYGEQLLVTGASRATRASSSTARGRSTPPTARSAPRAGGAMSSSRWT